ncbi:MAG: hypothetical protein HY537_12090 [Deltaproteobacteria bacterium]|nr:hypothetical protein [Deltaproteobacteria bacterium]
MSNIVRKTARHSFSTLLIVTSALLSFSNLHCQKKCFQPPEQPYSTFSDVEWRLKETTNPQVAQRLSKLTYLVFIFRRNLILDVYRVENNNRLNSSILRGRYSVDTEARVITADVGTPPNPDPNKSSEENSNLLPKELHRMNYSYDLGGEFSLTDGSGYTYDFVGESRAIYPDNDCEM